MPSCQCVSHQALLCIQKRTFCQLDVGDPPPLGAPVCVCVKTVITYGIIRLCRGPTGLIPGVGQRSSRFQTRISGRDAFLTYLQFCLSNVFFQLHRVLTLQQFFISTPINQLFASCVFRCMKVTQATGDGKIHIHPLPPNLSSVLR